MKTTKLYLSVILFMMATILKAQTYANLPSDLKNAIASVVAVTGYDYQTDVEIIDFQTYSSVNYGTKVADGTYPIYAIYSINQKKVTFHTSASAYMAPKSMILYFSRLDSLKSLVNMDKINTSNVTNMGSMFYCCSSLTSLDLSHFDTSNVTDMGSMFSGCSSLTSLDLSHFDTSDVTDMSSMFYDCSSLTSLDLSHFDTSNVTNMGCMFEFCSSLTSLDLSHFDTSNVTNMGFMFFGCSSLTSLDLIHFDTSNVTNMGYMFSGCRSLTSLDVSHFDTRNVTSMFCMFSGCRSLTSLDLIHFDTSNVTSMGEMFDYCSSLTSLDLSHFDTRNVTDMSWMFYYCSNLKYIQTSSPVYSPSEDNNLNSNAIVACPATAYNDYKDNEFWGQYQVVKVMPSEGDWSMGDVNNDEDVDIADLYHLAKGIMKQQDENLYFLPADVNGDKELNVTDYVGVTNMILGTYSANARSRAMEAILNDEVEMTARQTSNNLMMNVKSADRFTAIQMDVAMPESMRIGNVTCNDSHAATFSNLGDGKWRIMLTSMQNKTLQSDDVMTVSLTGQGETADVRLENIVLVQPSMATSKLDAIGIEGEATRIDAINANNNAMDVYNMSGIRMDARRVNAGLYIQNGKKVFVK